MLKKMLNIFMAEPVQLPLNFGSDIKFKDCIKSISAKHGSRGSLLQGLLVSYVSDEEQQHEDWRINYLMNEEPRKGEHD